MKRQRKIVVPFFALTMGLTGCVNHGKMSGHVYGADAKPIPNAVVKTVSESNQYGETETAPDGSFSVVIPKGLPGDKQIGLMVWYPGYKTYLNQFTYAEAAKQTDMKIMMVVGKDFK
ncbi:MAG: carboxypeptidase-like regulatory domain-containing protein [Leptolyngbya sp. BL-A-14]